MKHQTKEKLFIFLWFSLEFAALLWLCVVHAVATGNRRWDAFCLSAYALYTQSVCSIHSLRTIYLFDSARNRQRLGRANDHGIYRYLCVFECVQKISQHGKSQPKKKIILRHFQLYIVAFLDKHTHTHAHHKWQAQKNSLAEDEQNWINFGRDWRISTDSKNGNISKCWTTQQFFAKIITFIYFASSTKWIAWSKWWRLWCIIFIVLLWLWS